MGGVLLLHAYKSAEICSSNSSSCSKQQQWHSGSARQLCGSSGTDITSDREIALVIMSFVPYLVRVHTI
jgi:hypothetical protein